MMSLPVALYRAEQVAALDRIAIRELGIPGLTLMERAGAFAYRAMRASWPDREHLVVLCGAGNNAGDGYVVARLARQEGLEVTVVALADTAGLQGDAATVARHFLSDGGRVVSFDGRLPAGADVIVDALFGTGLSRPVEGRWAEAIAAANQSGLPVLAIDIPSGVSGNTGAVLGAAVRADITPTYIGLKQGLYTASGRALAGEVLYSDLELPAEVHAREQPSALRLDYFSLRYRLMPRARDGHKGDYGHVLVVGGDHGMGGAALMAARAALRTGAGLVSVATRGEHAAGMLAAQPELMVHGMRSADDLKPLLERCSTVVLGPGLGQAEWGRGLFRRAIDAGLPCVVDADALNLLAGETTQSDQWILTPHPGEAGRLLGTSSAEVQRDRFQAVSRLQQRYGGAAVLKGAGTLVLGAEGPIRVCDGGNPGMASGGTGDVLSGVLGALLAQQHELQQAAELGVCMHAAAGDAAAEDGERGLAATDLIPHLRRLANPL
ncbi:MAG: NAD(P)H-hydrate dehydratase [Ectothiorhodospiraceae bacterium]|nr:NAD(P)H-hydrate dehydratase [Ectothiorhodospiraceae bacterium]